MIGLTLGSLSRVTRFLIFPLIVILVSGCQLPTDGSTSNEVLLIDRTSGPTALPTLLVPNVTPTSIGVDSTNVYWSDSLNWSNNTSSVKKVSLSGGSVTTLASNVFSTSSLVVDSSNVYWASEMGLYSVPIGGGSYIMCGYLYATPIAEDSDNIYWAFSPKGVQKMTKSTRVVATLNADIQSGAASYAIAVDSLNVYWNDWGGNLCKVPVGGGSSSTLLTGIHASALGVDATSIYWSDYGGIHKIPINGGSVTTLTSIISPVFICVNSGCVYWASVTSVGKISTNGGTLYLLATSPPPSYSQNGPVVSNCIAVDSTNVYWGSTSGLYKIAK